MLDRSAICTTAALLARRAVARMGGTYASHIGTALRTAWYMARNRVAVAARAAAVAAVAVTPAVAAEQVAAPVTVVQETAVPETITAPAIVEPVVDAAPEPVAFAPPMIRSYVRGGGVGGSAWIALITGTDNKFGLAREFVARERHLSKSGRSGNMNWTLDAPGYYELRGLQFGADVASIGELANQFVLVAADGSYSRVKKADVLAAMGA